VKLRQRAHVKLVLFFPASPDETDDFVTWQPRDPMDFGVKVQLLAGTSGDQASDSFDILVCSPTWFAANWLGADANLARLPGSVLPGRRVWFMERWERDRFDRAIEHVLDVTAAGSWSEIANRLGRYIPWEFDYQYDRAQDELAGLSPMDYPEVAEADPDSDSSVG
jgi:hypothetical protein